MIQKININWENCYGIKLLKHEFLFGKSHNNTNRGASVL